ncbi:PAS domain-containing sensor histidine kinase, partial [Flavobacterium circumlabens]
EEKSALITIEPLPQVLGLNTQLRQLFYNLVNNSLKFNTTVPSVTISATLVPEDNNPLVLSGDYDIISIADNGIGIESQYSNRIFNMFQRLHERDQYGGN